MSILIFAIFLFGYVFISLEHKVGINKSATALLIAVVLWTIYGLTSGNDSSLTNELLMHSIGEISEILFFLLGAMTIVELIDSHHGFDFITARIRTQSMSKLVGIIVTLTFFLSAILDNLTTAIVMTTLARKLINQKKDRLAFAALIVIAANAGGAWSPIGDVTTTMLWIKGQITAWNIVKELFIPSVVCVLVPTLVVARNFKNRKLENIHKEQSALSSEVGHQQLILGLGIGVLISVPLFKLLTHLPPYMGMLLGLAVMWITTEILHSKKENDIRNKLSVIYALKKIDTASILFFLGILLSVSVLQHAALLSSFANRLSSLFNNNSTIIASLMGILSAIVDNVPLVAATQAMYPLSLYPADHYFWELLAFTTGTGGSIFIIGSAAGVAVMGIEEIDFIWYLKSFSLLALLGFASGIVAYIFESQILF
jgi:Na+/H+ antiporter NhaD/arsenite permease-like protein